MEGQLTSEEKFMTWHYVGPQTLLLSVTTADCALGCWLTLTKLRNLTKTFRFPRLFILVFPVTWIQMSRRLQGRKSMKTEDRLILQILTELWESHMNYLSLIISWFLKVPELSLLPGKGPLFWMERDKKWALLVFHFSFFQALCRFCPRFYFQQYHQ